MYETQSYSASLAKWHNYEGGGNTDCLCSRITFIFACHEPFCCFFCDQLVKSKMLVFSFAGSVWTPPLSSLINAVWFYQCHMNYPWCLFCHFFFHPWVFTAAVLPSLSFHTLTCKWGKVCSPFIRLRHSLWATKINSFDKGGFWEHKQTINPV